MRKITAAMIGALSGTAVMSVLIAAGIYQAVFYMSDERKSRRWQLPEGRQFKRYHKAIRKLTAEAEAVPFEPVRITSRDGLELFGRYYHIADGAPLIMLFHGYGGYVLRDLAGMHKIARENGINILAPDERAGGRSEGHTTTFGVRERYDVLDWLAWADRRFGADAPVILAGNSMGAATVCMAAGLELPANVKGVIADCPYTSPKDFILRFAKDRKIPAGLTWSLTRLGMMLLGRTDLTRASAQEAARRAKVPLLVLHGEDDRLVPCDMGREIFGAWAAKKRIETFPGAAHSMSYYADPERYARAVLKFVHTVTEKS